MRQTAIRHDARPDMCIVRQVRLTIASWSRFTPPVIMEGLDPRAGGAAAAATQRAALTASTRLQFPPAGRPSRCLRTTVGAERLCFTAVTALW